MSWKRGIQKWKISWTIFRKNQIVCTHNVFWLFRWDEKSRYTQSISESFEVRHPLAVKSTSCSFSATAFADVCFGYSIRLARWAAHVPDIRIFEVHLERTRAAVRRRPRAVTQRRAPRPWFPSLNLHSALDSSPQCIWGLMKRWLLPASLSRFKPWWLNCPDPIQPHHMICTSSVQSSWCRKQWWDETLYSRAKLYGINIRASILTWSMPLALSHTPFSGIARLLPVWLIVWTVATLSVLNSECFAICVGFYLRRRSGSVTTPDLWHEMGWVCASPCLQRGATRFLQPAKIQQQREQFFLT